MAIYLMSNIKHLFDKNDSLLMLFDEDGIADAREFKYYINYTSKN